MDQYQELTGICSTNFLISFLAGAILSSSQHISCKGTTGLPKGFLRFFAICEKLSYLRPDEAISSKSLWQSKALHSPVLDFGLIVCLTQEPLPISGNAPGSTGLMLVACSITRGARCDIIGEQRIKVSPKSSISELNRQSSHFCRQSYNQASDRSDLKRNCPTPEANASFSIRPVPFSTKRIERILHVYRSAKPLAVRFNAFLQTLHRFWFPFPQRKIGSQQFHDSVEQEKA